MGGIFVLLPEAFQRLLGFFFRIHRHQVGNENGFFNFRFFMKWLRRSRVGNKHDDLLFLHCNTKKQRRSVLFF